MSAAWFRERASHGHRGRTRKAGRRADPSQTRTADHVKRLGAAPEAEKAHWYLRASICVLPNLSMPGDFEGFGIVALEAAAAGCTVVALDLEGLRDALADGERGLPVPAGNSDAWIVELNCLLGDQQVVAALGTKAARHAALTAGWERSVDVYCRLFDALLDRRLPLEHIE